LVTWSLNLFIWSSGQLRRRRQVAGTGRVSAAVLRVAACCAVLLLCAAALEAGERYALVVTGASGGPQYAEKYDEWRSSFVQLLQGQLGYPEDHVLVLAEEEFAGAQRATRENVRTAIADLRKRATKDDVVLVVLVGHGSGSDSGEAKFNLVGPDLSARDWADLLRPLPGRLVFINAASGSFPFIEELTAKNHVVLTANDSAAQQFETVLPQFIVAALTDDAADFDKNGRTSMWELFAFVSARVRDWFEQRGQLATEHPMLDDNGDGAGKLVDDEGADGMLARITYLAAEPAIEDTGNPETTARLRRRAELNTQIEELRARKETMAQDDYEAALEKLLLELARIDRALKNKS
jgi:hypothetical protein